MRLTIFFFIFVDKNDTSTFYYFRVFETRSSGKIRMCNLVPYFEIHTVHYHVQSRIENRIGLAFVQREKLPYNACNREATIFGWYITFTVIIFFFLKIL